MSATGYYSALKLLLLTGRKSSLGEKEPVWERCFQPRWQEDDSHSGGKRDSRGPLGRAGCRNDGRTDILRTKELL